MAQEIARMDAYLVLIRSFVALQVALFGTLRSQVSSRDWKFLTDVPRVGSVAYEGQTWTFSVHGTGIRFESGGVVVDLNKAINIGAHLFDAGRIADYVESCPQEGLVFDYACGSQILEKLEETGKIRRVPDAEGKCYVIVEGEGEAT